MNGKRCRRCNVAVFIALALVLLGPVIAAAQEASPVAAQGGVTVVASGLSNPRGIVWDQDGTMYVAQAGSGLSNTAAGAEDAGTPVAASDDAAAAEGTPVVEGAGEGGTTASLTAGIFTVVDGCPTAVVEGYPSGGLPEFGWVLGIADLAFLDGQLYALVDLHGAGPVASHAAEAPNGVYRVDDDGTMTLVADISAWVKANPVAEPHEPISPDGTPFAMIAGDGMLWIAEANHQQVLTVTTDGSITRAADLSTLGNAAPDALAPAPSGGVYVGLLTALPFADGTARVIEVTPDGTVSDVWTGLTAVTSVAVAADGTLYALEMATGNSAEPPFYAPGTGKVVRQTGPDSAEEVVTGLNFPVKMQFGPDGGLYVSAPAIGANSGEGVVLRFDVSADTTIEMADQATTGDPCTSNAQTTGTVDVTNTDDAGAGSLRQAILDANARPGRQIIAFRITAEPDNGARHVILVQSLLPAITDAVTIDGTTQPGYARDDGPIVEINGAGIEKTCAGVESGSYRDSPGLDVVSLSASGEDASGTTIRGIGVSDFCEGIAVSAEVGGAQTSCPESTYLIAGVTISDSAFANNLGGNAAVDLCNAENSIVRDNRFANNGDHMELTRSFDVLVAGNEGSGAQDAVELIRSHRITIRYNRFSDGGRGGIVEGFGSGNSWIIDNVIRGMPASGMVLGDNNVVEGNIVTGSGWYGIEVRGASGNRIENNFVSENGFGGIAVYAGALRFLDDCSEDASGAPVDCGVVAPLHEGDAFDNLIAANVITDNDGPGILAGGEFVDSQGATRTAAGNTFVENTIGGNQGESIQLSDASGSLYFDVAEPYLGAYGEVVIVVPDETNV